MRHRIKILFAVAVMTLLHTSYAPPVIQNKATEEDTKESDIKENLEQYMEYHHYLKEVVQALESDSEFRAKLEKAEEDDIKTGKIAHELDFVGHNIRTQLDEIKRREMERLRHLATREYELTNDIDTAHSKIPSAAHIDKENPHTFEIEDLKRLIAQTTADLAEADRKRRDEFKQYELEKEYSKHQKMESMDEEHKKEFEANLKKEKEQQKHHAPLHHPGSKQQLEEVWEKQDHMEPQEFNPKVFFMLHDVDGNGVWDADEVKALFIKELDKMYARGEGAENASDPRERHEEMERMREHVFTEADTNRDGLIDYNEFLMQTRKADFEKDQGWQGLDENEVFTPEEYQAFEHQRAAELNRMNPMPQHPDDHRSQYPPQYVPAGQFHDPQYQQGYPQHGQYQPNPNNANPGQPQAQYHPGQQQQQQPQYAGQVQQQAQYAGQAQQAQYQGGPQGHVAQPQGHIAQPQQAQYHAGQLPQGHVAQPQQQFAQGQGPQVAAQGAAQPQPVQAQPAQALPAQPQPAQAQPVQAQPGQAQPAQSQDHPNQH